MDCQRSYLLTFLVLLHCSTQCAGFSKEMTFILKPRGRDCFFQFIPADVALEIDYQVVSGGDLDINFNFHHPNWTLITSESRTSEGTHNIHTPAAGDYVFCFDNAFSYGTEKLVYFEISSDQEEDESHMRYENLTKDDLEGSSQYEMTIEEFRAPMEQMKSRLDKSLQVMNSLKANEARDRALQERNFERVNFWSCVQLFIMVSVSLVQVLTIRNLFDDRGTSRMSKLMKMST